MPVLRLLKRHYPQSEIHWWLDANLMPLLDGDPDLAGIIPFQRKRWASIHRWPEIASSIRKMRRQRFDVAIDLQGLARSSMFAWLANAELTVGLDNLREGAREGARGFYDVTPNRALPNTHAVDRYLAVLSVLKVPVHWDFEWLPIRPEVAAKVREKWQIGTGPWIALLPGARWDNKRWPAEYFAAVAKRMSENPVARFVILGSRDEKGLGETIAEQNPGRCLNLSGETTLWEMIEWIRLCQVMITNDTGPMHVAAALNKPVVALFGPTNPLNTGPYRQLQNVIQRTDLPCVPCMKGHCTYKEPLACLHLITPAKVCQKAASVV